MMFANLSRRGKIRLGGLAASVCASPNAWSRPVQGEGIELGMRLEAEEWSTRPAGIVRQLRVVHNALHTRDKGGKTSLGPVAQLADGCLWMRAFPGNGIDCMLVKNTTVDIHIQRDVVRIL